MRSGGYLFLYGSLFYFVIGAIYFVFSKDPVGTTALVLTGGLAILIAFYLLFTVRRIGYQPEDNFERFKKKHLQIMDSFHLILGGL